MDAAPKKPPASEKPSPSARTEPTSLGHWLFRAALAIWAMWLVYVAWLAFLAPLQQS